MSTNPRDVLRQQQKAEKLRHYRSKRRRIIFCFLVFAALMFIFGMMWVDVYTSQMDIPSAMRTSRQDWAQWPIIPAFLFGVFAELARKAWKDANAMIKVYENDSGDHSCPHLPG